MNFHEFFEYRDGILYWKVFRKGRGGIVPGTRAGTPHKRGYCCIVLSGVRLLRHRIIWEMHNGPIPDGMEIDHINHVPGDDRIENLRMVTTKENKKNLPKTSLNTSGVVGVYWRQERGRISGWQAFIYVNGKKKYLGIYGDWFEAVCARKSANQKYGYHLNHGR